MNENEPIYIGIDWGREEHAVAVTDSEGTVILEVGIPHSGDGVATLWDKLGAITADASRWHVAIETSRGPVVEVLLDRGAHVYAINPKQLDRFRDRHSVAGAKDDRRDAFVLANSLRTDTPLFRALSPESEHLKKIRALSRLHDELAQELSRLSSRIGEQLWRYFPAMLTLGAGALAEAWFYGVWALIPTPEHAHKVKPSQVQRILRKHRIRRIDHEQALRALREAPLRVAPGTAESARIVLTSLFERAALVSRQLAECDDTIDAAFESLPGEAEAPPGQRSEQRDARIVRSLPGVGPIVHAALLAEAAEPLARRDYDELRTLCGVAPVTHSTGRKTRNGRRLPGRDTIIMRRACNERLRHAMWWIATVAAQHEPVSRAKYTALRARGVGHAQALRTVGDRLLKVICSMLETSTVYKPDKRQLAPAA
jgi:transposase